MHPRTIRALLASSDRPDAHYLQGYGQTETGPVSLQIVAASAAARYEGRNVGFSAGGAQLRVVDATGQPVPSGEIGHIESRSPGRMRGYIGGQPMPPDDDWWPMGDLGRMMPDGSLELLDRIVDHADGVESMLVAEDRLLDRFPELVEVVLVNVDGARLTAIACPAPGHLLDAARFLDAARELGLGPLRLHVWPWESMPLTGSYKVRRLQLCRRLAAAHQVAASEAALTGAR
jgi:acyl-coenzyme A synthetase/AMP-(fatty) acid ligase